MERWRQWENEGRLVLCDAAKRGGWHVENTPLWVFLFQHLCICFVVFLQLLQPVLVRSQFLMSQIL